jgi:DNA-binding transcriptional LysR family regulator
MAHAAVDDVLATHQVYRMDGLRVQGFHVRPLIAANSDLLAFIPGRLADAVAAHVPIKIFNLPVQVPPFDVRMFWHERYHHDPASRWMRRNLVTLYHASGENQRARPAPAAE